MLFQWTAVLYTGEGKGTLPPPPLSPLWGGGGLRRPPEQMSLLTFRQFSSLSRGQSAHQIFTPPPDENSLYNTI